MTQEEYFQARIDIENQKLLKLESIKTSFEKININLEFVDILCNLQIIEEVALNTKDAQEKKMNYLLSVSEF